MKSLIDQQQDICRKYGAQWLESPDDLKVGMANNVKSGLQPLNGLRHPPQGDTTGWYIWAGEELSNEPNFFVPLHVKHLKDWCPATLKFLGLPPGWRFLVADNHEDVWEDPTLLDI